MNTPHFKQFFQKSFFSIFFSSVVKLSSLFKVSFIVGSYAAFFSMTCIMMPLSGAFGGVFGAFAVSGFLACLKIIFGVFTPFKLLAYHIPGIFAALYWTNRSFALRFLLPLVCMAAFIVHPVGSQAFLYSFYWLIPAALYLLNKNNLFLEALGSTFIAHAVGSVIWIYAEPMTPQVWLGLIPVVAIERLVFALGMVVMHKVINYSLNFEWRSLFSFSPQLAQR